MEPIIAILQLLTVIVTVIYVVYTYRIALATEQSTKASRETLLEIKKSREIELAPNVTVTFDAPEQKSVIYLVVKNTGRSAASGIKIHFEPALKNSFDDNLNDLPFIRDGIASLAPGDEVRHFFESTIAFFGQEDLPRRYNVTVEYKGGITDREYKSEQIISLAHLENLAYIIDKDFDDLVKAVENISGSAKDESRSVSKLLERFGDGVKIRNGVPLIWSSGSMSEWPYLFIGLLRRVEWLIVYESASDEQIYHRIGDFQHTCLCLAEELKMAACFSPSALSRINRDEIAKISECLNAVGRKTIYMGRDSYIEIRQELDDIYPSVSSLLNIFEKRFCPGAGSFTQRSLTVQRQPSPNLHVQRLPRRGSRR